MMLKIGVIGPTNIQKLSQLTKKPAKFFLNQAEKIGKILAEINCELWMNCDKGMTESIARSYKKNNGKKLVFLSPIKGKPWPKKHVERYKKQADKIKGELNWFWANYNVIAIPDICICVGLSAGTLSELAYIKWNHQLKRGNLKRLIAIRELLRNRKLPPEIEVDIEKILTYISKTQQLKQLLKQFSKKAD